MARTEYPKVMFVLGATGTGKSKLAIELATRFGGEIINSDKIQVYQGLDVVTNKVTPAEESLVRHHLLNIVDDPDADFTTQDFRREVLRAVESIVCQGKIPIIAGGSNRYIEALVEEESFKRRFETCFFWLDVDLPVLHSSVSRRVDKMVEAGLVEEARSAYHPKNDYSSGVRRAIGVPEMHHFFTVEERLDASERAVVLAKAIGDIQTNTCDLTVNQRRKIIRFRDEFKWVIHRFDATDVFIRCGSEAEEAWKVLVRRPAEAIAGTFLHGNNTIVGDASDHVVNEEAVASRSSAAVPLVVGGLTFPVEY